MTFKIDEEIQKGIAREEELELAAPGEDVAAIADIGEQIEQGIQSEEQSIVPAEISQSLEEHNSGIFYGIGTGPGDPELLTLKAVRIIRECDILAVPREEKGESVSYQTALAAVPEVAAMDVRTIHMPMTKDAKVLEESHEAGSQEIISWLKEGKKVGFLTLGDPAVYSTYMYLHKRVAEKGYRVEIISGIPSFCAAAAALGSSLAENSQELHIIPATYQVEEALQLSGTKVLMKSGRKLAEIKAKLADEPVSVQMVENCTMADEKRYFSADELPDQAGYYSLVVVKEQQKENK